MRPNLLPVDPLSQVVFIHDYFQLVFQDSCFSIYNVAALRSSDVTLQQGRHGFCDTLVKLIGQSLLTAVAHDDSSLTLTFQEGTALSVASVGLGPEAWQFNCAGKSIVVAQNA